MRHTHALIQVACVLVSEPFERYWGYDLSRRSGVRSGVMYPILHRMFDQEWLTDGWEETTGGRRRPPRRYYELTELGRRELGALVAAAQTDPRFTPMLRAARAS